MVRRWLGAYVLALASMAPCPSLADTTAPYQLGHGIDIGPFNFAGYADIVGAIPDTGQPELALDDLSLFVSGHIDRLLNPFMEAELANFDFIRSRTNGLDRGHGDFVLERLYNDSFLTNAVTLRLGKMLSPVGEWNEIHAAPLVLTTVRPAVTYRNFSEYSTGAAILYSDPYSDGVEAQLYYQPDGELSERPGDITYHRYNSLEGLHLSLPLSLLDKIGVSFQHSRDVRGEDQSLYGFDYHYSIGNWTLQGEATLSDIGHHAGPRARDTEWGAYAAASYAVTDRWSVTGWYEGFQDRLAAKAAQDLLFGVAYRLRPDLVLRVEYLQNVGGPAVNPTGLFASAAVLF